MNEGEQINPHLHARACHEGRDFVLARNWLRGAVCHPEVGKVEVDGSQIGIGEREVVRRLGAPSAQSVLT